MYNTDLARFEKYGEAQVIAPNDILEYHAVFSDPLIEVRFKKFASNLKRITRKADEFLYFSAVMMHAAEASLVNADGTPKLTARGEPIKANWEKKGESWRWICTDSNVRPYKNSNGDIFPEEELLKAYKLWVGKPLCVDHKSSSVEAIRGIILDTYYDRALKRVIALCALDKITYPDLANKVSLGYSTCVSMGTAVGRAICSDCGVVARTEHDFCNHMRTKSCYGEINVDLQPIELSIVVNGADPQAKIRTIIAAANTVNNHLAEKEKELIILSDSTNLEADQLKKLEQLEESLKEANQKLSELKQVIESDDNSSTDAPYGQSSGRYSDPLDEVNQEPNGLNFPERYAYNNALINEVKILRTALEERLQNMEKSLEKLHKINKEETMSKDASMNKQGYWQGGGDVNEPTPGQKKYPVDPMNEKLRMEDKHMNGEKPFPEVGPVDGMHPSPESAEQKDELERKKMLARAERRAAALQKAKENIPMNHKEGYWQGGGGVNEPEPGKQKYPVDNLEYTLREKEDKQMVGQKPFPGVGPVDGMHPSPASADDKDELARKKLLQRASLKARWIRVANPDGSDNLGASGWHVYAKEEDGSEKLIFTASVNEISGGRSDALFDVIATKDFGSKMLEKIRTVGLSKAASVFKQGQAVAGPAATPGAPADMGGAGPAPAMPEAGAPAGDAAPPADEGGKGDPKDTAMKLAEKMRDLSSDLLEAVRSLTGEQSQMGEMEEGLEQLPKAASAVLAPLYNSRRELNGALLSGAKKSLAELREHVEELELIASVVDSDSTMNQEYIETVVEDGIEDAKKALADAHGLMKAYSKYVRGTEALVKRAEEAAESLTATAEDDLNDAKAKKSEDKKDDKKDSKKSKKSEKEEDEDKKDEDDCMADDNLGLNADDDNLHMMDDDLDLPHEDGEDLDLDGLSDELPEGHEEGDGHNHDLDNEMADDQNDTMVELPPGAPVPSGAKAVEPKMAFDLSTKEGRAAFRAKLAADPTGKEDDGTLKDESALPYTDMLDEADKLADGQTQLDVKPSDNLGLVETLEEQHKKDMEVAKAGPNVRKEAERLNELISNGTISAGKLDELISQGLDPEVVKYWKQYYGQAGKEGSEFGKLLTTETFKAKAEQELSNYKVKIARAYELANEMVRRGIIEDDRATIASQVEEIMQWNDEGFDSMKRVVAKHAPLGIRKEAATVPQVGLKSGEMFSQSQDGDFQSELDRAFSGRRY